MAAPVPPSVLLGRVSMYLEYGAVVANSCIRLCKAADAAGVIVVGNCRCGKVHRVRRGRLPTRFGILEGLMYDSPESGMGDASSRFCLCAKRYNPQRRILM